MYDMWLWWEKNESYSPKIYRMIVTTTNIAFLWLGLIIIHTCTVIQYKRINGLYTYDCISILSSGECTIDDTNWVNRLFGIDMNLLWFTWDTVTQRIDTPGINGFCLMDTWNCSRSVSSSVIKSIGKKSSCPRY